MQKFDEFCYSITSSKKGMGKAAIFFFVIQLLIQTKAYALGEIPHFINDVPKFMILVPLKLAACILCLFCLGRLNSWFGDEEEIESEKKIAKIPFSSEEKIPEDLGLSRIFKKDEK